MDIIRSFFGMLDSGIYSFISSIYDIIMYLSGFDITGLDDFANRLYALLGIFMLFKISFSFLNYIINPDSFVDKTRGIQKIIINILLVFVLLIVTPWAFNVLRDVQSEILEEQILTKFFLGKENKDYSSISTEFVFSEYCEETAEVDNMGDYIALSIFSPFYTMRDSLTEEEIVDALDTDLYGICNAKSINELIETDFFNAEFQDTDEEDKEFKTTYIDYKIIISSIAGILTLLILISFAFDIAVRTVKLYFLQLIAPIPIISYIEPDQSKSKMFGTWLKMVGSTWISLFIRLAALFFGIYVISHIDWEASRPDSLGWVSWQFAKAFVILGVLMFAKKIPQLIEELVPGLKLGGFELNPMKKIREQALVGNYAAGALTGGVAGTMAAVGGAASNIVATKQRVAKFKKDNPGASTGKALSGGEEGFKGIRNFTRNTVGTTLGGAGSSFARAIWNSRDGKFTPIKHAEAAVIASSTNRNQRESGYGIKDTIIDRFTDDAKISNDYGTTSKQKGQIKELKQQLENVKLQEQAYLQQLTLLAQNNPDKALAYNDAVSFEWKKDESGKQIRSYKYKDYEDYNTKYITELERAKKDKDNPNLEITKRDEANKKFNELNVRGVLDRTEFERAMTLEHKRVDLDKQGKEIEKNIKQIEENMQKKKD